MPDPQPPPASAPARSYHSGPSGLLAPRVHAIRASGIRRVLELGASMPDPINLSIGQPDFPVPEPVKAAAIEAIQSDKNGYTATDGLPALRRRLADWLRADVGWDCPMGPTGDSGGDGPALMVTAGTSGALLTAFMALIGPGDEAIIPDPYFVMYPQLASMTGGSAVLCDTYPDFRMTAARVEPLITERTKLVLFNSPGNPTGVVATARECRDLLDLCASRGIILISDEIYDEFTFAQARSEPSAADHANLRCPSPCRAPMSHRHTLLIRGFGKTYAVTGWRLGYAAGPRWLIEAMHKVQQFSFVCPPGPFQHAAAAALDVDMGPTVAAYQRRRDMVLEALSPLTDVQTPAGAFYAFPMVPQRLGLTASQLAERLIERQVLTIPGSVFSRRDTHLRLSYAVPEATLRRGLAAIAQAMGG